MEIKYEIPRLEIASIIDNRMLEVRDDKNLRPYNLPHCLACLQLDCFTLGALKVCDVSILGFRTF
ncbi:MAG TPA: hypothetical protein VEH06_15940 [Candidatus Bathyarchaeia archaeon]|nr:hypothetical protein [Candidatus Bathyarchaeia archaeon]